MTINNNDDRAQSVYDALQTFADAMYGGDDDRNLMLADSFEQCVSDFLGNLGHACDRMGNEPKGEVWHRVLHRAGSHYFEEVRDEEPEEVAIPFGPSKPALTLVQGGEETRAWDEPNAW